MVATKSAEVFVLSLMFRLTVTEFPKDFMFGAATSAYQTEGAWRTGGKGRSIWDHLTHTNPSAVKDMSNGDVAANSFFNYKRDIEMMQEVGINSMKFSISWPRILPTGFPNKISKTGVTFYNKYIDGLIAKNITPVATLYHWDLPQALQELGGFANPMLAYWFQDYANVAFLLFGDRVKIWITFNEPNSICHLGYGKAVHAPQLNAGSIAQYLCAKNLVLAHASAYWLYRQSFKKNQGGIIGISLDVDYLIPIANSSNVLFVTDLLKQVNVGLYANPIFSKEGGFPAELSKRILNLSVKAGYLRSRLLEFTEVERTYVKGTSDFFGVNHYTGSIVKLADDIFLNEVPVHLKMDDRWPKSASSWIRMVPRSLYHVLMELHVKYNTTFIVTENGWSTEETSLNDHSRITYIKAALRDCEDAINDGVDLQGYFVWSLMDNFAWGSGYTERFGLYAVDFNDDLRPRTARLSVKEYKNIIESRSTYPLTEM